MKVMKIIHGCAEGDEEFLKEMFRLIQVFFLLHFHPKLKSREYSRIGD